MPEREPIVAFDRETTPVSHTFSPSSGGGVPEFREADSAGVPIGDNVITVSTRKTGAVYRPRVRVAMPIVVDETVNGIVSPKVVRTAYADVNFIFSESSTSQERKNLLGILSSVFSGDTQPVVDGVCVGLQDVY